MKRIHCLYSHLISETQHRLRCLPGFVHAKGATTLKKSSILECCVRNTLYTKHSKRVITCFAGLLFSTFGNISGKDPTPMWLELFRRLRKLAIDGIECVSANGATATRSSKTTKEFKISDFPYKFKVCSALIKDDPQANVRH